MAAAVAASFAGLFAPVTAVLETALASPLAATLVAPVDELLLPLHDAANFAALHAQLPRATVRYLLAGFLVYPLALAQRWLPGGRTARDAWAALLGALTAYFVFGRAWASLLYSALVCFAVLRSGLPGRHLLVVAGAFGYLIVRQLGRASTTNEEMDDSVLHLVAVVKLFTLAFAVDDGASVALRIERNAEKAKAAAARGAAGEERALAQERKKLEGFRARAVRPDDDYGLLAFLGYVLNFTTVLGGPAFDFREYLDSQSRENAKLAALPSRFVPALWKFVQGVVYMAIMGALLPHYNTEGLYRLAAWRGDVFNPRGVNVQGGADACRAACRAAPDLCHADVTASFLGLFDIPGSSRAAWDFKPDRIVAVPYSRPPAFETVAPKPFNCVFFAEPKAPFEDFAAFLAYAAVAIVCVRVQYYAVWKLAEGACVLAGFGFRDEKKVAEGRAANAPTNAAGKPAFGDFLWLVGLLGVPPSAVKAVLRGSLCCGGRWLAVNTPDEAPMSDWEGVSNVNPITVETRVSMRDSIAHWNCNVQAWLANYVYLRLPRSLPGKHIVMVVSAFWHGFFPGYYLSFGTAAYIKELSEQLFAAWGKISERAFGWAPRDARAGGDGCQFPESRAWAPLRLLWVAVRWFGVFGTYMYSLGPL
jgi:hypothetical protein